MQGASSSSNYIGSSDINRDTQRIFTAQTTAHTVLKNSKNSCTCTYQTRSIFIFYSLKVILAQICKQACKTQIKCVRWRCREISYTDSNIKTHLLDAKIQRYVLLLRIKGTNVRSFLLINNCHNHSNRLTNNFTVEYKKTNFMLSTIKNNWLT